jgi:Tfp pilus assembly protein PilZ
MERRKGTVKEVSETELRNRLEEPAGDERRQDPRHPARLEVEVPLSDWEQVRRVYTSNISKGGLLFSIKSPAKIPATVELVLTLPDGKKVSLQVEVRHVAPRHDDPKEFEVGVQFQPLDADKQRTFDQILKKLATKN